MSLKCLVLVIRVVKKLVFILICGFDLYLRFVLDFDSYSIHCSWAESCLFHAYLD
ncbi:hypothetical protein JHK84_034259 [Glycine max]|nr:hypothetical protein JHK84_034259 [Glycine max]